MTPLLNPLVTPLPLPLVTPLVEPFQERSPIPPKEEYKTETKKEPPKGGKKESRSGELFPPPILEKKKVSSGKNELVAPTLDEVIQHFISKSAPEQIPDWKEQAEIFFNHFDSMGWRTSRGAKIERWESKANLWILDHVKQSRVANETNAQERNSDSDRQKLDVSRNLAELDRRWREEHGIKQEPG